ncbi:MAG TPA: hypothetical protein VD993_18235 [Chitinophagaceae bacterium]|nr:hypothetical protein [Chitinophagaceae bacterium]
MKRTVLFCLLIFFSYAGLCQTTTLVIKLNVDGAVASTARIMVAGKEIFRAADSRGEVRLEVPLLEKNEPIYVSLSAIGHAPIVWQNSFDFNGSGNAVITLSRNGVAGFEQWPVIVFESSTGTLDVYINGNSIGSTKKKKGVEPNREHTLIWKKDNEEKCIKKVKLPANVTRKYTCDSNGNISEG